MTDTSHNGCDIYRMAFGSLKGIIRRHAEQLLHDIGSERRFFDLSEHELIGICGFKSPLFSRKYRDEVLEQSHHEQQFVNAHGIRAIYFNDPAYPTRMNECDDAPILIYTMGDTDLNASHMISIVGTRRATPYGVDFVQRLVADLASRIEGLTIISGLAYGIDVTAHKAAIESGLPTIGVLAHGLQTLYPAAHRNLAANMVKNGSMLLTEYTSQMPVHRGNFLARNRIIAALCDCLVVAESAEKGGALVTANIASEYCRDVFALPGRTSDRFSQGCNRLISRHTAALISDADELISAMNWTCIPKEGDQGELPLELSEDETAVIRFLAEHGEGRINQMCVCLGIPVTRLMPLMLDMEFKGLVLTYPGGLYRIAALH